MLGIIPILLGSYVIVWRIQAQISSFDIALGIIVGSVLILVGTLMFLSFLKEVKDLRK